MDVTGSVNMSDRVFASSQPKQMRPIIWTRISSIQNHRRRTSPKWRDRIHDQTWTLSTFDPNIECVILVAAKKRILRGTN